MVIQQFPVQIVVATLILFHENVGKSLLELLDSKKIPLYVLK